MNTDSYTFIEDNYDCINYEYFVYLPIFDFVNTSLRITLTNNLPNYKSLIKVMFKAKRVQKIMIRLNKTLKILQSLELALGQQLRVRKKHTDRKYERFDVELHILSIFPCTIFSEQQVAFVTTSSILYTPIFYSLNDIECILLIT